MHNLVKEAFLIIMAVTIAMTLYMAFFGFNIGGNEWKGALYFAAQSVEEPIAQYYYKYCYAPNAMRTYHIDEALGASINSNSLSGYSTNYNGILSIPTNGDSVTFGGWTQVNISSDGSVKAYLH